jgi:hypothetical protein
MRVTYILLHTRYLLATALLLAISACTEEFDPTGTGERLCSEGAGIAARITGGAEPVEFCVLNDSTTTTYNAREPQRYELSATYHTDGDVIITLEVSFLLRAQLPATMNILGFPAGACSEGPAACFYYREEQPGVYEYTSSTVDGVFTLTIADPSVAVGTFANVLISLEDESGNDMGTRMIEEGFINVTPAAPQPRSASD